MSEGKKPVVLYLIRNQGSDKYHSVSPKPLSDDFKRLMSELPVVPKSDYDKAKQVARELRYYVNHTGECEVFIEEDACICGLDRHLNTLQELGE